MPWLLLPLVLLLMGAPSAAQPADDASGPSLRPDALGFEFSDTFLRDLPLSDSVYPLLETVQPSLILDRFTNGGLYLGRPARVGGFQASWSQTRFLLGDVDLSDPTGSGGPLLNPDLGPWQRVRVATGLIGSDVNASGLAIELPAEDGTSATVLAKVVHVSAQPEGGWLLGCDFISELSLEEVQVVLNLDPVSHASLSVDAEPRIEAVPTVKGVLFQAKYRLGEVLRWYVKRLDLSAGWPLERGKIISVRVGGVPAGTPPIELSVRDCRRFGSYWIVDGRLLAMPSEVILQALSASPTL